MLEFAIHTAIMGGKATLPYFRNSEVQFKENQTPVTIADLEAESLIRDEIRKWYPEHGIYGEEEGQTGEQGARWVIDPIDGTKSFVSGVPLYGTLLSFEEEGEVRIGVCYFPATDEILYAELGQGAFYQHRPARVMEEVNLSRTMVASGGIGHLHRQGKLDAVVELNAMSQGLRTWSDAYGHALVASGRVPIMIDPVVEPYDISAMSLIVQEAGGRCENYAGGKPGPQAISYAPGMTDWVRAHFP